MKNLTKILKIQDLSKIIIFLGILVISTIIIFLVISSSKKEVYVNIKNPSNPEQVISPLSGNNKVEPGYEIPAYNVYFNEITNEPYSNLEKSIYHWQNLFDIFTSNPAYTHLKYNISKSTLEGLSSKIQRAQKEFFKGSSDEIISEYGAVIKEEANYYKLDWRLILSIIKQESDFTSNAVSKSGAYGFMQIMPKTGNSLENTLNLEDHTSPNNNLIAGIYYYALLVARYDAAGDPNKFELALAAYNCGSGHVEDAMTIAYNEGKDYLKWDNVSDALKKLGPENDTLHQRIWKSKPPAGTFTNWVEPVNYVFNIMYYWSEYKKYYKLK